MRITESPHIRYCDYCIEVDLLTNDLNNIGNTLNWAFPDSKLTKGLRGETLLEGECGQLFDILVDFTLGVVYVSEVSEVRVQ